MRFRRLMAASMAGIMAVSSAIVCQISASAAEPLATVTTANSYSGQNIFGTGAEIPTITKLVYNVTLAEGDGSNGQFYFNIGQEGAPETKLTYGVSGTTYDILLTPGTATDVTLSVPDGYTVNQYWYQIEAAAYWGGDLTINYISAYAGDTLIAQIPEQGAAYDGTLLKLTENGTYNWQGMEEFTAADFSAATLEDLEKYDTLTAKFKVNGATVGSDDFDVSKINYQLCIGAHGDDYYYPWITCGSSTYDSTTNEVTLTANIGETIKTYDFGKDANEVARTSKDVTFDTFKLVAMVDLSNSNDTIKMYHEDISASVSVATYNITVNTATNGKVTADPKTAAADEKVTLTVTPDKGYKLKADSLKVTKKGDPATTVAVTDNKFVMPDYDVEVSAEFEKIAVESVSVKAATSLTVGGTETLVAKVTPDDAFDTSVTWKSSDTAVATVDENGKVTAVKAGTADITATTSNGKTATCTVTVTDKVVAATAVTVDPTTAELEVGSTVTITGKVTPDDSTDKITWKSSDTAVATVDAAGKVTAVKAGTADITATTSNGKTATCTVTVKAAPEKLEGAFEYAYDGSPIELTVGKATWNDSGLAAQKNASLEMKGVTFKTTTFGELKKLYSGIVINNLEIKNVPEGIKADEISVCIFIKSGSGWSWNSFNGTSVNFADITKISDSDAIMEVGYQLNYDIPAGTSYKTGDTITVNAKEEVVDPNAVIISPSTKVQQVDVKTDKNGNVTEQIAYFAISEKDAKTCESYIVTITRGKDNKKLVREIKNCFKTVQYKAADGSDKTVVAADGAYCVLLDITNIGSDYGALTIKIEPKK